MEYTLHDEITVAAPPDDVFDRVLDVDHLTEWNREIARIIEPRAAIEVGAQWVVEIRAVHTHWPSRSELTRVDRDARRFAYRSVTDDGNPSHADWRWQVDPDPAGAHVTVEVDVRPRTFWRRMLLARYRRRSLRLAINTSLRALAQWAADDVGRTRPGAYTTPTTQET
jgi:uncharacterized protein YndB with AHSA1/START domain